MGEGTGPDRSPAATRSCPTFLGLEEPGTRQHKVNFGRGKLKPGAGIPALAVWTRAQCARSCESEYRGPLHSRRAALARSPRPRSGASARGTCAAPSSGFLPLPLRGWGWGGERGARRATSIGSFVIDQKLLAAELASRLTWRDP